MSSLVWLDTETTGLDPKQNKLLEVACIITTPQLIELGHFTSPIFQTPEVLENMNPWCKEQHPKSGLLDLIPITDSLENVEKNLLQFLDRFFNSNEKLILCGNTITFDRGFIKEHMPTLDKRLHYRMIDVSAWKVYMRERYQIEPPPKKENHRALVDAYESIMEMKYYDQFIYVNNACA